jgi:type III restriction enzyme
MIALKDYQERVLASLRAFLGGTVRDGHPDAAFRQVQEQAGSRWPVPYVPVAVTGFAPDMPYICLRVPTGGGKTLLGCHAVGIAQAELLRADHSVALWLVPSNAILDQTIEALRDVRHPYRRALEESCGSVDVLTVQEALMASRATLDGQTVVIVATLQSFRVEDTAGRKVYAQNGSLLDHFTNLPPEITRGLTRGPDGKPVPSLVNVLRLRRPIVIVDEAHNARTELSFETLGALSPSCIIEFTATPATTPPISNVLHRVSAAELKAAEMIKMPVRVVTRAEHEAEALLAEAVTVRSNLERLAMDEVASGETYVRPILLIQAEKVEACEELRQRLVGGYGFGPGEVRISVGSNDELADLGNLMAPECPLRAVITVQRLREGWDCPFAYVLCSLRPTRSPTAIEQIVGRVMRLPYARARLHEELNCAYVFSMSPNLDVVLADLRAALVSNGFTPAETERIVLGDGPLPMALTAQTVHLPAEAIDAPALEAVAASMANQVVFTATSGTVTILRPLPPDEARRVAACLTTEAARGQLASAIEAVRRAELAWGSGSPAGGGASPNGPFVVPLLAVREDSGWLPFDETMLLEQPWRLSQKDASLPESYNPSERPAGKTGVVDVGSRGEVQVSVAGEAASADFVTAIHQHVLALGAPAEWSLERLVVWLDRSIEHRDVPSSESCEFFRKVIRTLLAKYPGLEVGRLALDRFRLRNQIQARIEDHRHSERQAAFRQLLLPGSALGITPEHVIDFGAMSYDPSWWYDGAFQFKKHYFSRVGELREATPGGELTEEASCARFLDGMPEVRHWVRNLSRRPGSFHLQTSTDRFYPDFVCQLVDGRVLVVEYKGADRYRSEDAEEKRLVGDVWASRSAGRCLFAMPTALDFNVVTAAVRAPRA